MYLLFLLQVPEVVTSHDSQLLLKDALLTRDAIHDHDGVIGNGLKEKSSGNNCQYSKVRSI